MTSCRRRRGSSPLLAAPEPGAGNGRRRMAAGSDAGVETDVARLRVRLLNGLASSMRGQERLRGAEPLLLQALNLAALYQDGGRFTEAEDSYRRALTAVEHVLGHGHREAANLSRDLAVLERE